jgi:hypothetical protein
MRQEREKEDKMVSHDLLNVKPQESFLKNYANGLPHNRIVLDHNGAGPDLGAPESE